MMERVSSYHVNPYHNDFDLDDGLDLGQFEYSKTSQSRAEFRRSDSRRERPYSGDYHRGEFSSESEYDEYERREDWHEYSHQPTRSVIDDNVFFQPHPEYKQRSATVSHQTGESRHPRFVKQISYVSSRSGWPPREDAGRRYPKRRSPDPSHRYHEHAYSATTHRQHYHPQDDVLSHTTRYEQTRQWIKGGSSTGTSRTRKIEKIRKFPPPDSKAPVIPLPDYEGATAKVQFVPSPDY